MIDLHSHTTCSDGLDTPHELIIKASKKRIKALAITDHDTIEGLKEGEAAADQQQLLFIRGVELEITNHGGEFHLLGLNLGYNTQKLEQRLMLLQQKRTERNLMMIDKMREIGLPARYEEIKKLGGKVIGRPHFAQYLINEGKVKNLKMAFDKYLGYGRPLFFPKESIELEEAVALIKETGGYPVIAHPLSLYLSWGRLPDALKNIRERGVEGLEAYHSACTKRESERLALLAEEMGFFVTGGSDYHGQKMPARKLGHACKDTPIEDTLIKSILSPEQQIAFDLLDFSRYA